MNFYLIYLNKGFVVDICSYDNEEAQLNQYRLDCPKVGQPGCKYDDIQIFNEVR